MTASSVSGGECRDAHRDVDVGRGEHAGVVEGTQQSGRVVRAADVVWIVAARFVEVDRAHPPTPRSSTSLSATTSAAGGRQAKTPHGVPSTVGVSGPVIPRTNR